MISLRNPSFRQMAAIIAAVGMLFWLYTFYAIGRLPRPTIALGIAGLVTFAVVWMQLLAEFPKK